MDLPHTSATLEAFSKCSGNPLTTANPVFQQVSALATSDFQNGQNRVPMNPGQPHTSPNADALAQHADDLIRLFRLNAETVQRSFRNDRERLFAGFTAIPLETVLNAELECF